MDVREKIQQEAKEAFLESNRQSSIILPTGTGKSKVCIDILKYLQEEYNELEPGYLRILLLTNSTDLRDSNWKKEFEKWDYDWELIQSECFQTAYKPGWQKDKSFDVIIYDEADFALTGEYQSVFHIPAKVKLAMTGFITEEKELMLQQWLPIVYRANVEDLQQQNILNKSEFILLEYPLNMDKNIERKLKTGGTFKTSENDEYKYWDKQFQQAVIVKSSIEKKLRSGGGFVKYESDAGWRGADFKFKMLAAKRKKVLHTLDSTIQVTKNLLTNIHSVPNNKVIIFNTLTEQADKLPNPFHGKSEEDASGIESLNRGEINTLSVVKKLTRGVNLVGVNYLIRATYDGSETDFFQSHGRIMRLKPGEVAKYVILLPIYKDLVKIESGRMEYRYLQTQAERWKNKMMEKLTNPVIRTIRLDNTLQLKTGQVL